MYCCFKIIVKNDAPKSGLVSLKRDLKFLRQLSLKPFCAAIPEIGKGIIKLESGVVGEYNWGKIVSAITEDCL